MQLDCDDQMYLNTGTDLPNHGDNVGAPCTTSMESTFEPGVSPVLKK